MNRKPLWIDAHGHLTDERWQGRQAELIQKAQELGVGFFMQGGVDPEDWQRQLTLKQSFPEAIGLCFGLHPYWVAVHSEEECEDALDSLARMLPQAMALGELGLDFRPHIMNDSQELQIHLFEQQLELAQFCHKPVVLHLVQAHAQTLKVMDLFGLPDEKGLVHSFNGSLKKAQDYIERGLYISVGGPVCRPDNEKLHQAVRGLPLECLLLESDTPDQGAPAFSGGLNPPESICEVARTIGELKSLDPREILDITTANFKRLFNLGDVHGNTTEPNS